MDKFFKGLTALLLLSQVAIAQTADEVIALHEKARGGKEKLLSIKSIYMDGSMVMMGNEVPVRVTKEQGKLSRTEFDVAGAIGFTLITTEEAWNFFPTRGTEPNKMPDEAVAGLQQDLDIPGVLIDYASKGYTAMLAGKEASQDGSECFKITLKSSEGKEGNYWISTSNYLLVQATAKGGDIKSKRSGAAAQAEVSSDEAAPKVMLAFYKDYKPVEGILFPYIIEFKMSGFDGRGGGSTTFNKIELNKPVDAKLYKPS